MPEVAFRLGASAPAWTDVMPGVRIRFAPITTQALRAARRACGKTLDALSPEARASLADAADMTALADADRDTLDDANDALGVELIRRGILEWEGIGDVDGKPVPVTPETVEMLIADPLAFDALEAAYVRPFQLRLAEKNVLSPSSNGSSAAATAGSATASSHAKRARSDAKPAPTASTPHKPAKAKRS